MIFIGLGSNLGNKQANILLALELMEGKGIEIKRVSSFYTSEPWGITDQDTFINAVCEVDFGGMPEELLTLLLNIEIEMGRERLFKWGPRLIDLDIIEFNKLRIDTEKLKLPHPFYIERSFVLVPMAELEPRFIPSFPTEKRTLTQILDEGLLEGIKKIDTDQ